MARPIRVDFEDVGYQVTGRAKERHATFRSDCSLEARLGTFYGPPLLRGKRQ
jgi:hypothetical protein